MGHRTQLAGSTRSGYGVAGGHRRKLDPSEGVEEYRLIKIHCRPVKFARVGQCGSRIVKDGAASANAGVWEFGPWGRWRGHA